MSTATGIHISGNALRVVCLEKLDNTYHLRGLMNRRVSASCHFDPQAEVSEPFIRALSQAFDCLPKPLGTLSFALSAGLYHIQRVPLEVAAEEDRREQIVWEVSQVLISSIDDSAIDFLPVGRAAFWTAVRNGVIHAHETLCHALGETRMHLTVAPLALFYAGLSSRVWEPGRQMAVHPNLAGSFCIFVENGILIAVETTGSSTSNLQHWLSLARLHPSCKRIYLSEDITDRDPSTELSFAEYPTFRGINTARLPKQDRAELRHPGKFALALGAATHSLSSNLTLESQNTWQTSRIKSNNCKKRLRA